MKRFLLLILALGAVLTAFAQDYKYVEATSVTPFADRARDRALQTRYVILC